MRVIESIQTKIESESVHSYHNNDAVIAHARLKNIAKLYFSRALPKNYYCLTFGNEVDGPNLTNSRP
jgi:hypothetical protein